MMRKFREGDHRLFDILNRMNLRRDLASPLTEVLGVLVLCFILYVGGRMVFSNANPLNSGDLISFILCFAMMINPSKNLATTVSNIKKRTGGDRKNRGNPACTQRHPREGKRPNTGTVQ